MPRSSHQQYVLGSASSLALILSLLTGCSSGAAEPAPLDSASSGSSPSATPDPSTSQSPKPSKSTSAPALPDAARGHDKRGREAFVRHAVNSLNFAVRTLDTSSLVRLFSPTCDACQSITDRLADIRQRGGHIEGGQWSIVEVAAVREAIGRSRRVNVAVDYDKQVSYRSQGAPPRRFPAGRSVFTFGLQPTKDSWLITDIQGSSQ